VTENRHGAEVRGFTPTTFLTVSQAGLVSDWEAASQQPCSEDQKFSHRPRNAFWLRASILWKCCGWSWRWLIDLETYRTDLFGTVCNPNVDLPRTATVLHFGPGGDVIGQIALPDRYRGPPHLFAGATGIVAVGLIDGPPGGMVVVAVDASGRVASRHPVPGAFEYQVVATRGGFAVVTEPLADLRSRTVQAFDATGVTTWTTTLEGPIPHDGTSAWMVAHNSRVVVTLNGEERFGLDAATGTPVWHGRADHAPRAAAATAAPLQPAELITLWDDKAPGVEHVSVVALDARSGATRTLLTLDSRPRALAHGFVQDGRILPERFTRAGNDLWMIGLFGGRLSIGAAVVEVDTVKVRRYEDVCQIECLRAHSEYVLVGNTWELFIARVPLAAAP
jgi:putative pyrroloquinoline-quinone binding quinoprotein